MRRAWSTLALIAAVVAFLALAPATVVAQAPQKAIALAPPQTSQNMTVNVTGVGTVSAPLQIVILMTLLTFVPAALVMMTSFTRIAIVFHFLRQALGTQEMPSNQMLVGLALFLTMFIMAPTATKIQDDAIKPVMDGKIDITEAMNRAAPPLRDFMLKQTRETDLALFVELSKSPRPASSADLADDCRHSRLLHLGNEDRLSDGLLPLRALPAHRPRRVDDAALDGHDAAAAGDDLAAVQSAPLRDDRRLEPPGRVPGPQLQLIASWCPNV